MGQKIERQLQGILSTVFTQRIQNRGLESNFSIYTPQEESRADISLKNAKGKLIFFIELKDPTTKDGKTIYNFQLIRREAQRAFKMECQYFGICNFIAATLLDRQDLIGNSDFEGELFTHQEIAFLQSNFSTYIGQKNYTQKLEKIVDFYLDKALELTQKKKIQARPLDEVFIFIIRDLITTYLADVALKVQERYNNDSDFSKRVQAYTRLQQWNSPTVYSEFENLAFISMLVLVSKLIFYKTYYDRKTWAALAPLHIPDSINTAYELQDKIWSFFEEFKEVTGNFEVLIGASDDIIFELPFTSDSIIELVSQVIHSSELYDFSKIEADVIGRIFEELIRPDERHKLGQYFTPPPVIDVLLSFAIQRGDECVFDPSCGSGTFLVRAYERKRLLANNKEHTHLLDEIYGNDLSNYPAYLAMLNLAIRNPAKPSYPRIFNKDFFAIQQTLALAYHNYMGEPLQTPLPAMDAIIGNPPYTRQEDIGALQNTVNKDKIHALLKNELSISIPQRASIYACFFYHAFVFLKPNGYLTFIVSNSWLDTNFGEHLQGWLCEHFRIVAIMESEVERFFPSASVNTSLVVLQKNPTNRSSLTNEQIKVIETNMVRFVYFRQPLRFILENTKPRNAYRRADSLRDIILSYTKDQLTPQFRISLVPQTQLKEDNKWGKFLKAPDVYFEIFHKHKEKFVRLKDLAKVKFGIKTGANEFFLVDDITDKFAETQEWLGIRNNTHSFNNIHQLQKNRLRIVLDGLGECWLLEEEFLQPVLASPKNVKHYKIIPNELKLQLLLVTLPLEELKNDYPHIYSYIINGEKQGIHERPSCASRPIWYKLNDDKHIPPSLAFNYMINDVGRTFWGSSFTNNNFHNATPLKNTKTIWLYLNSTFSWLYQQLAMRSNLGDGVGKIEKYEFANFPIPDINLESLNIDLGTTRNYLEELGDGSNVSSINPQRWQLDVAILSALGFENADVERILNKLYIAVIQLISARLQKARSQDKVAQKREKSDNIQSYLQQIQHQITQKGINIAENLAFAKSVEKLIKQITSNKNLQHQLLSEYWKTQFKRDYGIEYLVNKEQGNLFDDV